MVNDLNKKLLFCKSKAICKILSYSKKQQEKIYSLFLNKWKEATLNPQTIRLGVLKLEDLNNKISLKRNFKSYKEKVKEMRRWEVIETRMKYTQSSNEYKTKTNIFIAFSNNVTISHKIKTSIRAIAESKKFKDLNKGLSAWKIAFRRSKEHDSKI